MRWRVEQGSDVNIKQAGFPYYLKLHCAICIEPPMILCQKRKQRESTGRGEMEERERAACCEATDCTLVSHNSPMSQIPSNPHRHSPNTRRRKRDIRGTPHPGGRWQKYGVCVNVMVPAASREWSWEMKRTVGSQHPRADGTQCLNVCSCVCMCECTFLYVFNSLWWAEAGTRVWRLRWKSWRAVMSGSRPLLWTMLLFEGDVAKVTRSLLEMRVGVKRLQQRNLVLLLIIVWGLCIRGFCSLSEESLLYRKTFDQSKLLKLKQKQCVSSSVKKLESQWDLGRNVEKKVWSGSLQFWFFITRPTENSGS